MHFAFGFRLCIGRAPVALWFFARATAALATALAFRAVVLLCRFTAVVHEIAPIARDEERLAGWAELLEFLIFHGSCFLCVESTLL